MAQNKKQKILKQQRHLQPLRWRIFLYLLGFTALLLLLLWLFQTVYLDSFYRRVKISEITGAASAIAHNIDNENILTTLDRLAAEREMCIQIFNLSVMGDSERQEEIAGYDADVLPDCLIHHLSLIEVSRLYNSALEAGGPYTEVINGNDLHGRIIENGFFIIRRPGAGPGESMVLSQVFNGVNGDEFLLLLDSKLQPVNATVHTLRVQLTFITALMVVTALLLSFFIAWRLAAPITRINIRAKRLAAGDFSASFDGQGYREIGELAETLNYAAGELSRTERLQRELVANISHDLRTPLTMISGYAEVMRDLPQENNAENAQVIIDEARRLSSLVNEVLDLSKLQSGVEILKIEDFDIGELLEILVENYRRLLAAEGYNISLESCGEAWVHADKKRIEQVLCNFLNNAFTYTGADKQVSVRQIISAQKVRIEVADSGQGIAPEHINEIWQRYYRLEGAHKRAAHGAGIGLSIARQVLEQHKADYGVESKEGLGSIFWFELALI
ncbi:MAG: HAMP domain-containing histidine kinase [Firmicutes bacterium]|nr:HAMP domain-containing histidine kinase [Bacillota bacterium]